MCRCYSSRENRTLCDWSMQIDCNCLKTSFLQERSFWNKLSPCTSPNKGETAVHCCDPPLSVLVMLVSRNVFHVVSALQSIVFIYLFSGEGGGGGADQVSCRSYVGSAYRMRSLAVSHSFMEEPTCPNITQQIGPSNTFCTRLC